MKDPTLPSPSSTSDGDNDRAGRSDPHDPPQAQALGQRLGARRSHVTSPPPVYLRSMNRWTVYGSPLGPLTVSAGPKGLRSIHFPRRGPRDGERGPQRDERLRQPLPEVTSQLDQYFAGKRRAFE